eukprot:8738-Amphidinium_carterae.1
MHGLCAIGVHVLAIVKDEFVHSTPEHRRRFLERQTSATKHDANDDDDDDDDDDDFIITIIIHCVCR